MSTSHGVMDAAWSASPTRAPDCITWRPVRDRADDLRERLRLIFGDAAHLRLTPNPSPRRRRRNRHACTNMSAHATALIADDEPLLREALRRQLASVWPELEIVAEARHGREAVRLFDERHPESASSTSLCRDSPASMPPNHIGRRAHLVFVTAYHHYAVQAFAQGALDYLLKPVEQARLAETVSRLRERLHLSEAGDQHRAAIAATERAARQAAE